MEFRGKRVLITGASRGIGEALAHSFPGATVALVAPTAAFPFLTEMPRRATEFLLTGVSSRMN